MFYNYTISQDRDDLLIIIQSVFTSFIVTNERE